MGSEVMPDAGARAEFTSTGCLRAGLNYANFLLINRPPEAHQGVVPDLARELARRLGTRVEFVGYENAGLVADAAKARAWDVAFIGAEPARAGEIEFTPAYVEIEATYLVAAGSTLRSVDEVDRKGIRVAAAARSAYDLFLTRSLKHAEIVRADGLAGSRELFLRDKLDVLAGLKPRLLEDAGTIPGARILEGNFTTIQQAMGAPKGRAAAARYLRAFAEDVKASGLVAGLIARHGVRGLSVAPLQP